MEDTNNTKYAKRYQGIEWRQLRQQHKLKLVDMFKSTNDHYRALVEDECGNRYIHWLNDTEAAKYEEFLGILK